MRDLREDLRRFLTDVADAANGVGAFRSLDEAEDDLPTVLRKMRDEANRLRTEMDKS
jgi:hypothetical protein